ncbi:MAG TPA: dihydrolipoamide acetyltransferase family protein [Pseudoduganella sp.]
MSEFTLPFLGPDVEQGKLLAWQVGVGDMVRRGQVVCVVDTAKAAVDVESWQDGVVQQLLVEPGEPVRVGQPLLEFAGAGAPPPARRRISPAARKLAQAHGIDPVQIQGSGPEGTVALEDVQAALAKRDPAQGQVVTADMRQVIAAAMARSKREIPHYYLCEDIPLRTAQQWLAELNAHRALDDRVLLAALLLKAVALAVAAVPALNGCYTDGAFRASQAVNLGVAIALRGGGLVAPALQDAAAQPLERLMRNLGDLVRRARAGTLRSSELSGGTITVTNLGEQGCDGVFGVIYPPQVALVGFGRVQERPWVLDGKLVSMPVVTASLAADHRVTDGHDGARFLTRLNALLQTPAQLALPGGTV